MTLSPFFIDVTKIIFVLVLLTAAVIITQRTLNSLFSTYAMQSLLVALLAGVLYWEDRSTVLLLMAILTIVTKVIVIPFVLRRIQKNMSMKRDLDFRYLSPTGSILLSTLLIFLVYEVFSHFHDQLSQSNLFFLGAVIGVSLTLMGMLVTFTRKMMVTKILGYLTMENGVLIFSLFISELPFIIEVLIILDLIMLIVLSTVLAFGIDSTVEDFHKRLNSFSTWFED